MKRLNANSPESIIDKHRHVPIRPYIDDPVQRERIIRARNFLTAALNHMGRDGFAHHRRQITELGCNGCDISGFFSWGHAVQGFEISPYCIEYIAKTYPWVRIRPEDFTAINPEPSDILVLCEILEHLNDPESVVKLWLPKAKYAVISSPLDGDLEGDSSGGEHSWSYSLEDFERFVALGEHVVIKESDFQMGVYKIHLLLTKHKGEPANGAQAAGNMQVLPG